MTLSIDDAEFEQTISLREAYFTMFELLNHHWHGCSEYELGGILGELSLWKVGENRRAPMDAALLSAWIDAANTVLVLEREGEGYPTADSIFA